MSNDKPISEMTEEKQKPENPYAFPVMETVTWKEDEDSKRTMVKIIEHKGLSLRDYFASNERVNISSYSQERLEQIAGRSQPEDNRESEMWYCEVEAKIQYMKADVMLKERSK